MALFGFLVAAAALVVSVATFFLLPKAPKQQPKELRDLEAPTFGEGREIPVVFGTVRIKAPNALWHGERSIQTLKIKA